MVTPTSTTLRTTALPSGSLRPVYNSRSTYRQRGLVPLACGLLRAGTTTEGSGEWIPPEPRRSSPRRCRPQQQRREGERGRGRSRDRPIPSPTTTTPWGREESPRQSPLLPSPPLPLPLLPPPRPPIPLLVTTRVWRRRRRRPRPRWSTTITAAGGTTPPPPAPPPLQGKTPSAQPLPLPQT